MKASLNRFRVQRTAQQDSGAAARIAPLPACRRCRQLKKRCTRTAQGCCALCALTGRPCSLMEEAKSPVSRERELQARIEWLSGLVDRGLPAGQSVRELETGATLTGAVNAVPTTPEDRESVSIAGSRRYLQAYFRHVHRAYPFLDSEEVMTEFDALCQQHATSDDGCLPRACIPSRLYGVMAIGATTLQRAGEALDPADGGPFEPCAQSVIEECVASIDNTGSLGTLLLLGLHLLFRPTEISPWAVAGILTRQAIASGLVGDSGHFDAAARVSPRDQELRRRLGWSIYVFDRMIAVSYGVLVGIAETKMRLPLPSIMLHKYAAADGQQYTMALQVSRHVIALRHLETRIAKAVHGHLAATGSSSGSSSRANPPQPLWMLRQDLRRQVEDWYTQGCLLSSSAIWEQDQVPFHNTITWLNVRYQNLLLLLYSPPSVAPSAPLGPVADEDVRSLAELQAASNRYVHLSWVLYEQRHLPFNRITLNRLLSLGAVLLYCVTRSTSFLLASEEISLCASLLKLFPAPWEAAHRGADILDRLVDLIAPPDSAVTPATAAATTTRNSCSSY
ncbi:hypothetical protein ASPZODRAFT_170268 [Penicilliopsis zonata CBS 506.65]|uniref:Zn(2)-C6 fungal-type domain-containing protein n=1 Tax=Penicilliopsis zonata CBS 506.65 TaxID=1073090 RepID=A0A1L9S515_9EURO|nr:hypothetical protein ASPZODRAFT_170268 [Penicilliopsis zonata CBS 506.65]OJJ42241.1 hypothetical protein ASPZODRAFT_170268 [Penicilliopsis zonata CBS 506.65]